MVKDPGRFVRPSVGNRELSVSTPVRGPRRQGDEPTPVMNDAEKSDLLAVAMKPVNKPVATGAESLEPGGGAKGNTDECRTVRTQCRNYRVPGACSRTSGRCGPLAYYPSWEPGARIVPAGICAGGAQQWASLPRCKNKKDRLFAARLASCRHAPASEKRPPTRASSTRSVPTDGQAPLGEALNQETSMISRRPNDGPYTSRSPRDQSCSH